MIISPFTPLYFPGSRSPYGGECPFMQFFGTGDLIYMQVIRTSDESPAMCKIYSGDNALATRIILPVTTQIGGAYVDAYSFTLNAEGIYSVSIGGEECEPFEVTSDQEKLDRSVLIEYSPAENSTRNDVVPVINGTRCYFAFRVPGGFKPDGYEFAVDNEQYVSQNADIVELYARESMQETLTVGWSRGVPIWFGQMLNRLLTCRYVYIDGLRYARYQSSVPDKTQTMEGVNGFIFTQKLQRINHLEPIKSYVS